MTVPGGVAPCAGITYVGVMPSHRRRGVLTELMREQLDDLHERGEPLAALWASEPVIYGRFGYGIAAPSAAMEAEHAGFAFRDDPGPSGTARLLTKDEARTALPADLRAGARPAQRLALPLGGALGRARQRPRALARRREPEVLRSHRARRAGRGLRHVPHQGEVGARACRESEL